MNLTQLRDAVRRWYAGYSARDQRIILGVVAVVLTGVFYVGIVDPVLVYRRGVAQEIADGQESLERSARFVARTDALNAERDDLARRLDQAKTRLLPGDSGTLGAATLQEKANAIATEKGITVQSTQVMKEEVVEPFRKVAVRLTLSGELKPFVDLVSALELGQHLTIPFVEVNRRGAGAAAQKGPRTLTATLEVNGFVMVAPAPKPGAPDAEGAAENGAGEQPPRTDGGPEGGPVVAPPGEAS